MLWFRTPLVQISTFSVPIDWDLKNDYMDKMNTVEIFNSR